MVDPDKRPGFRRLDMIPHNSTGHASGLWVSSIRVGGPTPPPLPGRDPPALASELPIPPHAPDWLLAPATDKADTACERFSG